MEERVLFQYAGVSPRSWKDLQNFAREQLVAETGLPADHFGAFGPEDYHKLLAVRDFCARIEGTEKLRVISDYFSIMEGSQYLQSVSAEYPKPSLLMSPTPLYKARDIGKIVMPLRGAIQGMRHVDLMADLYGLEARENEAVSWAIVKAKVEQAKTGIAGCTPFILLNYVKLTGPLPPKVERGLRGILENVFGTKLPDYAGPTTGDGAKPN